MSLVDGVWVSTACPSCGYGVDFRVLDARLDGQVWCSGCYSRLRLRDELVSVELSDRALERTLRELEDNITRISHMKLEILP